MAIKKGASLFYLIWLLALTTGCFNEVQGDSIEDSLSYKKVMGIYQFVPDLAQAAKLKLSTSDTVILTLNELAFNNKPGYASIGKYYLNTTNNNKKRDLNIGAKSWRFSNTKLATGKFYNTILLEGLYPDSVRVNFVITRDYLGTIYLTGYESNERYPIIYNFKKVIKGN